MGLIREPKEIDFYVIEKKWTDDELLEFRKHIQSVKSKSQQKSIRHINNKTVKTIAKK
jgi:hypothetical protein